MARTVITPTAITRAGVAPPAETAADVPNGNAIPNTGAVVLLIRNSNGGSTARVLTIALSASVDGQSVTPKTYSIAAAASRYIGPFPVTQYGNSLLANGDNAELKIVALQLA